MNDVLSDPINSLGISPSASVDLAVDYLLRSQDWEDSPLLDRVVRMLFDEFLVWIPEKYDAYDITFEKLNRLLKSDFWYQDTLSILSEMYINAASHDNNYIDVFIEFLVGGIEVKSRYLVKEDFGYFEEVFLKGAAGNLSPEEQFIYCLHAVNIYYYYFTERLNIEISKFAELTRDNLIDLSESPVLQVGRSAIWALFWCNNSLESKPGQLDLTKSLIERFAAMADGKFDSITSGRIVCILIKANQRFFQAVVAARDTIEDWYGDVVNHPAISLDPKIKMPHQKIIEKVCLDLLKTGTKKYWSDRIIRPSVALLASKKTWSELKALLVVPYNELQLDIFILLGVTGGLSTFSLSKDVNVTYFKDQIIAKKGHLIHKLKAKDTTGRWAYYFVLVSESKESAFLKSIEGDGTIDLEDYGAVVASCYGEEPSQEVKDYLKEKYRFDV